MKLRHLSFDETEQVRCLHAYLAMRCEVFLDFDPVPYPDPESEPVERHDRGWQANDVPRA